MSENEKIEQAGQADAAKSAPAKADKKAKDEKKSKPGFFARVAKWFKEMKSELKKVQWPGWKQVAKNTGIVIACVIVVGIFIWVFDALANAIVQALLNLFNPGA
ncbi:MAG: preprotein translocase subunit SecE [Pseudoflavonifractor capillosus]|uniref:preprotein translocase subunit SecE n=1 Tax=Pseudoflavonifractor capillosus TaxID=106588 RepID=UPI0008211BF4|nr:preprotein translocase subunit SecE [Pseudoflavonifractor capillosus]MCI5928371.1 preprotein translocase subunit SecE [Pseudoflavonifractor capillosus]MDY4661107.1 preprotein translocase subunit SecE [Pseudoflavonifractor capillosus]SCI65533.1 Preprotein translocase subunit secE [uncultured Flavonifractor sp.]